MTNQQIATHFARLADVMELRGDNLFKIRAYRRAAQTIDGYPRSIAALRDAGSLTEIDGIGSAIADKIGELLDTGRLSLLDRLEAELPAGVATLMQVPEIGPKSARALYDTLGIDSIEALAAAAEAGRLEAVKGIGPRTVQRIVAGIEALQRRSDRSLLGVALPRAEALLAALQAAAPNTVLHSSVAGSLRRCLPTIGDMDLLVAAAPEDGATLIATFNALPWVAQSFGSGERKSRVQLHSGEEVDLRVVEPRHWGCALAYFTGSKEHNIRIREIAQRQGYSLNEYRLVDSAQQEHYFEREAELYDVLGLPWIPPTLREDQGEIAAARAGELPELVQLSDLRGDLHMHSRWSDGKATILEMGQAAKARGYEYIAITDHSQSLGMTGGLTPDQLIAQRYEIINANAKLGDFRILQGAEVEIKADGTLDYPDEVLAQLDVVVASMHSGIRGGREENTRRLLNAIRNPHVHIIGHMTNRLLGEREGADLDVTEILRSAAEHGTILEINAHPKRLDLDASHGREAIEMGCLLSIDSDAHSTEGLEVMRYGVMQAQRAWAEAEDVINSRPLEELLGYLS
ncbi:MAG: DNA polymerase/3'-5' exonuclease PolX [Anaerolineales bacterium]|nr:DNA polymerase/3'-5' exonuclease PolX [Anaerolineales bacterium]MCB9129089.1 DNA polymerase/3'-5' exonuclease PolX [Ardenticatenales bacterium]MCB9172759.1 DNA polymerase/3'-5' exonuclease PolX [Ardenticatenales bacterium]